MENWKFENTDWLWALPVVLCFVLLFWLRSRSKKKKLERLGDNRLRELLFPQFSSVRMIWKNIFLILAFIFMVLAMANPQVGSKFEKVKVKGAEIIIALDVSNSMLAEDITPNRLDKARQEIIQLLVELKNDKVGLIIFAGKSFLTVPLTTDYAMIKMYLRGIDTDVISTQGTDIGGAIQLAMDSYSDQKKNDKALIIITDGENHESDAVEEAKKASEAGISVHTIGLGKKEGVPLPYYTRYGKKEFRKDRDGNVVVSRLNEELLNNIAAAGKGQFILANNYGIGLDRIYKSLKGLEKNEFKEKMVMDYEDDYQIYLWVAMIFLVVEFIILPRKNKYLAKIKLSEVKI